jgi:hypothetical protein
MIRNSTTGEAKASPFFFMKRISQREREMAQVMADLFDKGSPEIRIAEHFIRMKFTERQTLNMLQKINTLPVNGLAASKIILHYRELKKGSQDSDDARSHGYAVRLWLKNQS